MKSPQSPSYLYGAILTAACSLILISNSLAAENSRAVDEELNALTDMTRVNPATRKSELGSLRPETALQRSRTVSVITKQDFARYNFQTIGEALRTLAGMDVWRTHFKKGQPTSRGSLQPHYPNDVLMMIDDVPTWNAVAGGGLKLNRVNIHDVERVEVLKGPAGALYGNHAYSAVINIVLRDPAKEGGQAHVGVGDGEKYFGGANYAMKSAACGGVDIYASTNHSSEDGEKVFFTGEKSGDPPAGKVYRPKEFEDGGNYLLRLKNENHRVLFNAFRSVENNLGNAPHPTQQIGEDLIATGYLGDYRYRRNTSATAQFEMGATFDWSSLELFSGPPGNVSISKGYRHRLYARKTASLNDRVHYRIQADYDLKKAGKFEDTKIDESKREAAQKIAGEGNEICNDDNTVIADVIPFATFPCGDNVAGRHIAEYSLMGQLEHTREKWKTTAAARVSYNDITGTEFAPHLAAVYSIDENNSVRLSYDEAYRTPSILELYITAGVLHGNEDLDAQKTRTVELGYTTSDGPFFAQLSGWWASFDDRIFRDRFSNSPNTYLNADTYNATGVEMELSYTDPKKFNLFFNANYYHGTDGDNPGSGSYNALYVPSVALTTGVSKDLCLWTLSAVLNYVGAMTGLEGVSKDEEGTEVDIDPTAVLDLSLARKQRLSGVPVLHRFAVKNVTDEETFLPEFARNSIATVPWKNDRRVVYDFTVNFR